VVVENGYSDRDQASEAEYWTRAFPAPHTAVHRLHFFASSFADRDFPTRKQDGYLGYAVVTRPLGRLIRALMRPPPCMAVSTSLGFQQGLGQNSCSHCSDDSQGRELTDGMLTAALETVELYGIDYSVVGVPFCGQEAWHLQCGHTVAWTCLHTGHLRSHAPRTTIKEVIDASSGADDYQRAASATGTNLIQLQRIFTSRGMPALAYDVAALLKDERLHLGGVRRGSPAASPTDEAIFAVVCNYLNSGFPVVAATENHALTVIGWRRTGHPDGRIELLVSDTDEIYGSVAAPGTHLGGWRNLMIPLPPTVVLSGEAVQNDVHRALRDLAGYVGESLDRIPKEAEETIKRIQGLFNAGQLSLRVQLKLRQDYKRKVVENEAQRGAEVAQALSVLHLPEWVWVVEVQERTRREEGQPCVVADVVFDTTSPDDSPHQCSVSLGPVTWCIWPYEGRGMTQPVVSVDESRLRDEIGAWTSQINPPAEPPKSLNSRDRENAVA
jgi:hypothetical protein